MFDAGEELEGRPGSANRRPAPKRVGLVLLGIVAGVSSSSECLSLGRIRRRPKTKRKPRLGSANR